MLTPRELKGFNFEKRVHDLLNLYGFFHEWNPVGKGADFRLGGIEIEAKFSHAVIYPSWILRDWISRFSNKAKTRLVVVNRGIKLHWKAKVLLRAHGIRVVPYNLLVGYLFVLRSSVTSFRTSYSIMDKTNVSNVALDVLRIVKEFWRKRIRRIKPLLIMISEHAKKNSLNPKVESMKETEFPYERDAFLECE
jgi:hypothetical protein